MNDRNTLWETILKGKGDRTYRKYGEDTGVSYSNIQSSFTNSTYRHLKRFINYPLETKDKRMNAKEKNCTEK